VRLLIGFIFLIVPAQLMQDAREAGPVTQPAAVANSQFKAIDVFIDSKDQSLAAYQFELHATAGDVKIVGIEGGEHAAYKQPPFYDAKAMMGDRVIVAAYSTLDDLPLGKTRIARVHVRVGGNVEPKYELKLTASASKEGKSIAGATVSLAEGKRP
jgi:hypothetical protein